MQKLLLYLVLCISFTLSAVSGSKTNIYVIDSLIYDCSDKLFNVLLSKNKYDFYLKISDHPAADYIKNGILSHPELKHFVVYSSEKPKVTKVTITVKDLSIQYENNDSDTEYNRIANLTLSLLIESHQSPVLPPVDISSSFTDTVDKSKIEELERNSYDFAKGSIPEEESSLFDEILEPVIVIGSTAIAVILFFTVRSG